MPAKPKPRREAYRCSGRPRKRHGADLWSWPIPRDARWCLPRCVYEALATHHVSCPVDDYQLPAIVRGAGFFVSNVGWAVETMSSGDRLHT